MQTLYYYILSLVVVVPIMIVLVRLYRRRMHLVKMAEFYRDKCWREEPEEEFCYRVPINDTPLRNMGYTSGEQINREIEIIIYKFKKEPKLLEKTERDFYEREQRNILEKERKRKELIAKRVFAYDYEDLLFLLYEPTAKEDIGGWRIEEIAEDDIIKRLAEIKNISMNEAEDLFKILVDHELIWTCGHGSGYELTQLLQSGNTGWDVVSYTDMNFDKWMVGH